MRALIYVLLIAAFAFAGSVAVADEVAPIYMSNKTIGGGDMNLYTKGVAGGSGVNNIGLLIKTFGKVTYVNTTSQFFYIDDGWGKTTTLPAPDSCTVQGIRVSYGGLADGVPAITPPLVDNYVAVTGIVSTVMVSTLVQPNVRARRGDDVQGF
jgi:hypothetical protein